MLRGLTVFTVIWGAVCSSAVTLNDSRSRAGYVSLVLINEVPFPGEKSYVSVADSKVSMLQILWVLHNRVGNPPQGYTRRSIAAVTSPNIIEVISAGGARGQVDGFYRARDGTLATTRRVQKRLDHLVKVANSGPPGKFADLLHYAKHLGEAYFSEGPDGRNVFAELKRINGLSVTGNAYAWMTDEARFSPGGHYVPIPDRDQGALGGNRFYTLKRNP